MNRTPVEGRPVFQISFGKTTKGTLVGLVTFYGLDYGAYYQKEKVVLYTGGLFAYHMLRHPTVFREARAL